MIPHQKLPLSDPSQLALSCPLCEHGYEPYQARIVRNHDDMQLWYVVCTNCLHGIMLMVTLTEYGVNSVGIVTDMTGDDLVRFEQQSSITSDDCLALHSALTASSDQFLD